MIERDEVTPQLTGTGAWATPVQVAAALIAAAGPALANQRHLFVDDRWIADTHQVARVVPAPTKEPSNPLLVADRPWEGGVNLFGTVLHDEGRFRMWYQVYNLDEQRDRRFRTAVAYAESEDGLNWSKPALGLIDYEGEPTNLVLLSHGTSDLYSPAVVRDDADPDPSRRYKMLYWDSMSEADLASVGPNFPLGEDAPGWVAIPGEGFFVAFSPDGLRWTNHSPQPAFTCACDASSLLRRADGSFEAVFKISTRADRHFRVLGRSTSTDFTTWSEPEVVLEPDWRDAYGTEFYGMSAVRYFGNELGLLWMYYNSPDDKSLDLQLATRRDGAWQRAADRRVLLPRGERAQWDAGGLYAASDLIIAPPGHPDEVWLYYGASSTTHDDTRYGEQAVGLARMRLDGFAAMHAGYFDGELTTTLVEATGEQLVLNLAARQGQVTVVALDTAGRELARSAPLSSVDRTSVPVAWASGEVPPGSTVQLRFLMRHADLFAFWFE
jgi:hypothetical protein